MVWIQAATEDGFSLETGGVARDARFRVVAAQRNGGRVTIVRTFPVTCDSPRAQGIGVGPSGWMVCWTHTRDGVTELLMATPAQAPRVIRAGRIWEARLVTLDDGTVLLGLIELEGRRPMLRFYRLTSDGLSAEPCGPAVEGAWSVAMAPAGGRSCWLAWDRHSAHRLLAEVGQLDAATGRLARHPLPGSGFATMPSVCPLPGRKTRPGARGPTTSNGRRASGTPSSTPMASGCAKTCRCPHWTRPTTSNRPAARDWWPCTTVSISCSAACGRRCAVAH